MEKSTDQTIHDDDAPPPPPYVPPPYEARPPAPPDDILADPLVEPTIFILAGQSVHAETTTSPSIYQLSRAVATLTKATEKVQFERIDATASHRPRPRHLYDLRRSTKQPRIGFSRARSASDAPEYYIHAQSPRRTLGHVGLAKGRHGFRALPVQVPAATTSRARFAEHAAPVFELRRSGDRARWVVVEGEETVAIEDAADEQRRLILMKGMPRKEVDALVALWCCSVWQDAAERAEEAGKEMKGSSFIQKMDTGRGVYLGTNIY